MDNLEETKSFISAMLAEPLGDSLQAIDDILFQSKRQGGHQSGEGSLGQGRALYDILCEHKGHAMGTTNNIKAIIK